MTTIPDLYRSNFNVPSSADILCRDHAGDTVLWTVDVNLMDVYVPLAVDTLPFVTPDWHVKATADFDGFLDTDNSDILWQNDNGALALWQILAGTVTAIHALGPNPGPSWHVVGDNDFNGNAADDILFQNNNGALVIWTVASAAAGTISGMFAGTQNPGPTWHVVGTGDTNSNEMPGREQTAGILWQNGNGALVVWEDPKFAAGTFTFKAIAALPTVDPSWHVKGMADLDGDGRSDIVFQNDNGAVAVWQMGGAAGTTINAANLINLNPGPTWHIVALRDMSGDLHA